MHLSTIQTRALSDLMRLVANEDPVPELISQYAVAQFQRSL